MISFKYSQLMIYVTFIFFCQTSCKEEKQNIIYIPITLFPDRTEDFSLWQLEAFDQEVQMGYVIKTDDNNIVVIDGGGKVASAHLENFLIRLGGTVNYWIISHFHADHSDALLKIIKNNNIEIKNVYHSALDEDWIKRHEPKSNLQYLNYTYLLNISDIQTHDINTGNTLPLGDGVNLTVLGAKNEEIHINAINNSSLIFKIESKSKSILFLGDLGPEGGDKLIKNNDSMTLKANYVQMAHHGSNGVKKNVYKAINPDIALWPTPIWLWENNDNNQGIDTGSWETLEVRHWMNDLDVGTNYVSGLGGTVQID